MATMRAWVMVLLVCAGGCRRGSGPIDPNNPDALAPCPAGVHLSVALTNRDYDARQVLLRFAANGFAQCQGAVLPYEDYGYITTVGGMDDGTDLVGFSASYGQGGTIVRVEGDAVTARLDDTEVYPIGIARLTWDGENAVAITWGSGWGSSSDSGERISVHAAADLRELGRWDVGYQAIRAGAPPSGQGARLGVLMAGAGLQEMRADPGATTLATTGELAVSMPYSGTTRGLDVLGAGVRVSADEGVLYWGSSGGNAFLGPVTCRWPDVVGTPLPMENARYIGALVDPRDPIDRSIVLVDGELEGGSDETTHVFAMRHRGECERLVSIPDTHAAVAIAWSGR